MKPFYRILFFYLLFVVTLQANEPGPVSTGIGQIEFTRAEYVNPYTSRIPFKIIDHLIVVEGQIANKKGNFIIDTGSECLILNRHHFKSERIQTSSLASSVSGSLQNIGKNTVDSLSLSTLHILEQKSHVLDLSHIEKNKKMNLLGIIGYETLKEYEIFIDFYLKQITLTKTDTHGERLDPHPLLETIQDSINFKLKKHTIVLDCYVNGVPLKFGLDSGAEINMLHKRVPKAVLKNFRIIKPVNLTGMKNRKIEVLAGKLYQVKLKDNLYCGVMRTILADLKGMYDTYGTELDGVLGYEFLAMKRIIINYKKEKLYFAKLPFKDNR